MTGRRQTGDVTLNSRGWSALRRGFAGAVAPALWLALSVAPVAAQVAEQANVFDHTFQAVLNNPANLNNTLRYAAGVTQDVDVENAISTYDRLLFYNPALSRVRYELGVLYFRLGSYQQAQVYFESALRMRDVTPELAQHAQEYLAIIARRLSPDQFTGFAWTGVRYQTNASLGPGPQAILASGRTFDTRFLAHPDWNWFGQFGLNYIHDFGTQNGDAFEATLLGYDAQQFSLHQFDLAVLELRAGPRFVFPDSNGTSIKPYVVGTGAALADNLYQGGVGGGVTVHAALGPIAFDPYVEIVQQSFRNSGLYPLASNLSGTLQTYALQAAGPIVPGLFWQARVAYQKDNAVFNPYGYNAVFADLWLPWTFTFPGDRRVWIVTPNFGFIDWLYNSPDPFVDPFATQHSIEWRAALNLDIPIYDQLYFTTRVQYLAVLSNISVFTMRDLQVSFGPSLKF